ncbi:hypothetical protein H9L39_19804 [Fusarium oxysporum f. sp. albedinis]|nr:hypothetical protein H9L39_19804 [Fusarium oxysporum f. sp. albedinis]
MRLYEPTLQLGAFSRRPDDSQLTLYLQPRRNKGLSYNTDAEDMAHVLAKLHNFDVVYIAGMDRKFLKAGHAFAFATIIVSYPLDVERMPNKVPRQMYQIEPQKCEGPWASKQLPTGSKLDTIASTR